MASSSGGFKGETPEGNENYGCELLQQASEIANGMKHGLGPVGLIILRLQCRVCDRIANVEERRVETKTGLSVQAILGIVEYRRPDAVACWVTRVQW